MGQAKDFKRLRKMAELKYEPQGQRGYNKQGGGWRAGRTRGEYRALKALYRAYKGFGFMAELAKAASL